jgi:hypothetical protein
MFLLVLCDVLNSCVDWVFYFFVYVSDHNTNSINLNTNHHFNHRNSHDSSNSFNYNGKLIINNNFEYSINREITCTTQFLPKIVYTVVLRHYHLYEPLTLAFAFELISSLCFQCVIYKLFVLSINSSHHKFNHSSIDSTTDAICRRSWFYFI